MTVRAALVSSIAVIEPEAWLTRGGDFSGEWQGRASGAAISIIANHIEGVGKGAPLHKHAYAETFVVRRGVVVFTIGAETVECREGHIIVVPAGVPHSFRNQGPGALEMLDIHESGVFVTEWLD